MIPMFASGLTAPDPFPYPTLLTGGSEPIFNYTGRTQVFPSLVPGEHTTIILTWGDSLAASTDNVPYAMNHPTKIQELSIQNGGLYLAATPALGCTDEGVPAVNGFWGHRLADKLIDGNKTQRVILCNMGVGSTGTATWNNPTFTARFKAHFLRLNALGLLSANKIFILNSIGGLDQTLAVPAATVTANINGIITAIRASGWTTTRIYLALSSWASGSTGGINGVNVRNGITSAIAGNLNTFTGADTDTIPLGGRYDGSHYNASGSNAAASLWYNIISPQFP